MKSAMEMTEKEINELRIEHGIKIKEHIGPWRRYKGLIDKMEPGDSVLVKTLDEARNLMHSMWSSGIKGSRRKDYKGYRVWRMD